MANVHPQPIARLDRAIRNGTTRSVTAHGTTMAYVFPTLVAMGFGYFVTEEALKRFH